MRTLFALLLISIGSSAEPLSASDEFVELTAFANVISLVEVDPTFIDLMGLEDTEGRARDRVHQDRLRLLRARLNMKYGADFRRTAPRPVGEAAVFESPLDDILLSHDYIAGRARPLLRQLVTWIESDEEYRNMLKTERGLVHQERQSSAEGTPRPQYAEYDLQREAFERRVRDRFDLLKYAFGLKSPGYVHHKIPRARTYPIFGFKSNAPFFNALEWDVLRVHEYGGLRPRPYRPYLDIVAEYLGCADFFD